jgi:hypothetical protein
MAQKVVAVVNALRSSAKEVPSLNRRSSKWKASGSVRRIINQILTAVDRDLDVLAVDTYLMTYVLRQGPASLAEPQSGNEP